MPWTLIPDSDVDAESPLTESLAKRWRDNPKAVADGSAPYGERVLVEAQRTASSNVNHVLSPDGLGGLVMRLQSSGLSSVEANGYSGLINIPLSGSPQSFTLCDITLPSTSKVRFSVFMTIKVVDGVAVASTSRELSYPFSVDSGALLANSVFPISLGTVGGISGATIGAEMTSSTNFRLKLTTSGSSNGSAGGTNHTSILFGAAGIGF